MPPAIHRGQQAPLQYPAGDGSAHGELQELHTSQKTPCTSTDTGRFYHFPDRLSGRKLTLSSSHRGNSSELDCARRPAGRIHYLLNAVATSTATATVAPTIGLLPMPRKPIISTWAGTDEEPAN